MSENATPASGRAGAPPMAACAWPRESQRHMSIHVSTSLREPCFGKPGERSLVAATKATRVASIFSVSAGSIVKRTSR